MQKRIKELRKTLNLTQTQFGNKIGTTRDSIAGYERGSKISETTIRLICSVFNVNYFWLTEGKGDMFNAFPETILDEVVEQFELTKEDKLLLESYLEMSKEQRETIMIFLQTFAKKVQKKDEE